MIEWKDKIEQKKPENINKISADEKYEIVINPDSANKSSSPYFFISREMQTVLMGYGHGDTQLEAMKDCLEKMEKGIEESLRIADELQAVVAETENSKTVWTPSQYEQAVNRAKRRVQNIQEQSNPDLTDNK